ncbi:MAG: phosphonate metabolism protein/1,5-bisphosphokinase (PRPP-forming) PhnN [Alphaproteobacteria bacterium]|nr:phosphonate metabolism protein/1,5-bisphosphokinase (PRPP-forming) PhnN [Alphaproteobacteria bacterium]
MARGTLFLVVGPSGSGKDSLMAGARPRLGAHYLFARRAITRAAEAGGEAHEAVSEAEFDRLLAAGGFSLHWRAYGLAYGIRSEIEAALAAGRPVVVNVSRAVIAEAQRLAPIRVLHVTAPADILAARLAQRGRENAADRARRLARAEAPHLGGVDIATIVNDADLETGISRFLQAIVAA